jgi:hypothetical protein
MPIDRRITNGLAWAGAVLVVAIPAADFVIRQTSPQPQPQVSVVQPQPQSTVPDAQPSPDVAMPVQPVTGSTESEPVSEVDADPIVTAQTRPQPASSSGDPVDSFLQSGRDLPSYISGGSPASATSPVPSARPPAAAAPQQQASVQPTAPAASQPQSNAAPVPPARPQVNVTLPTPVSQRPPSVPQSQARPVAPAPSQPPLVIRESNEIYTAEDLEDWESGPLSEFLANRGQQPADNEYDADGFFLDEGPNNAGSQQFPRAYGEGFYYPFSD